MRHFTIMTLITLCVILTTSCDRQTEPTILNECYHRIARVSMTDRPHTYSLLTPEERNCYWKERIDMFIKSESLTPEETEILTDLSNLIDHNIFLDDHSQGHSLLDIWENKALKVFPAETIVSLLYSVQDLGSSEYEDVSAFAWPYCNCAIWPWITCSWFNSDSKCESSDKTGCKTTKWGCGILWSKPCEGICK